MCVSIGSGNGLLPGGTKLLIGPVLTNYKWDLVAFTVGNFIGNAEEFENYQFKITATSPRSQWVNFLCPLSVHSRDPFLGSWPHNSNAMKFFYSNFDSDNSIRWWIMHVTAQLLWHVKNCDLIHSLFFMLKQHAIYKIWMMSSQAFVQCVAVTLWCVANVSVGPAVVIYVCYTWPWETNAGCNRQCDPTLGSFLGQWWTVQDCFLQKEARVCVSDAIVIEDGKFKWCFFVVEDEQVIEEADVLMWI